MPLDNIKSTLLKEKESGYTPHCPSRTKKSPGRELYHLETRANKTLFIFKQISDR